MRLMTWNVNGLRSLKIPLKSLFDSFDCDVICLQETKVTKEYLVEELAIVEGYNSYFSFSKTKSGYSGVATFVRNGCTPLAAEEGLSNVGKTGEPGIGCYGDVDGLGADELARLDAEGRCIMTEHEIVTPDGKNERLVIVNVYCPRADLDNEERLNYKLNFYKLMEARAEALFGSGRRVIIVGDINTSHRSIDHCDPSDEIEFQSNPCRQWMNSFIHDPWMAVTLSTDDWSKENRKTFVDVLRIFHPNSRNLFTNWCSSTGARVTNYGTRLDYIFADKSTALDDHMFADCQIRPDVEGSDHCPVVADLSCIVLAAFKCPPLCSKYFFVGKQQKLFQFVKNLVTHDRSEYLEGGSTPDENGVDYEKVTLIHSSSPSHEEPRNKKCKKNNGPSNSILNYFSGLPQNDEGGALKHSAEVEDQIDAIAQSSTQSSHLDPSHQSTTQEHNSSISNHRDIWGSIFKGPRKAPSCKKHKEPCILRNVKKPGPNKGRNFWVCGRPEGHRSNDEARCDHFEWSNKQ